MSDRNVIRRWECPDHKLPVTTGAISGPSACAFCGKPAVERTYVAAEALMSREALGAATHRLDVMFHGGLGPDWETHDAAQEALRAAIAALADPAPPVSRKAASDE